MSPGTLLRGLAPFGRAISARRFSRNNARRRRRQWLGAESLEPRAMLSTVPFLADSALQTATVFTAQGRYGNNALNGDWELGITTNTNKPPQQQTGHVWNGSLDSATGVTTVNEQFTFDVLNTTAASFSVGGSNISFDYAGRLTGNQPNAIKIWAKASTANSSLTLANLKLKTPGMSVPKEFPAASIAVSQSSGPDFQQRLIAGVDFSSGSGQPVTLTGDLGMSFAQTSPRGSSLQFHVMAVYVPPVDLDVDSDNDGSVQSSAVEDAIEDIAGIDAKPGKVLLVNDQDTDNDGIQDYFDGFNAFASLDEDDLLGNASFAPMSLMITGLPSNTPVTLDYSGSDPSLLIEDSTGRRVPAPGHLRVWTVDAIFPRSARQLREGGHYVPPGTYSLQELGGTSGHTLTLYVEAIRPSVTTGDLSITVSVPSTPLSDRVRFTSTQFTVLGKALDEPFQETGFFIASTLPSPAAIGQDGLMAGAYREYRVQINDPRTTTTSVQIAGASLPLSRSGTTLESPTFVLIAPGATAHPTLRSIEASGSFVSWAFNAEGRRRLVTSFQLTEWDTELAGIIVDVIKQMDGTWRPSNPDNPGEFGNVVHQRVGERLKGRAGWAVDVYVRDRTNEIVSIGTPPDDRTNTTQIDALKLKPGYTLEGKKFLDYTQIDDLYDVKTTASGIPDREQAERLKSVLNGWQSGGQRSIKVGMVERRWVASAGWVDNVRYKNAIGLVRMIGLAAGVAQTAETAHAMWTFKHDDAELQSLLDKARKVKAGQWLDDGPPSYQRALFIKLEVNPFLRKRFGNSAVLDLAEEAAFQTFLRELQ
jgi:hypothetical protein